MEVQNENTPESISEDNQLCNMTELMDLPEPVLLHVMHYFSHHFLRHVASRVSREWKRLAHSQILWSQASLECDHKLGGVWNFIRDVLVTPYLHHLKVNLSGYENVKRDSILAALISTHCRLYRLTLKVDDYGPEIVQFLQQHRELRELELCDRASDDHHAARVAATVGQMASSSGLSSLILSQSTLLHMPKAGYLLASPPPFQVNSESQYLQGALDLQNVDSDNCDIVKWNQPRGLLSLVLNVPSSMTMCWTNTTVSNLVTLLRAHKHALKRVEIQNYNCNAEDIVMALSECTKLEELTVLSSHRSDLCAYAKSLQPTLRHFKAFALPWDERNEQGIALAFETLCLRAPRLETLELNLKAANQLLFPGFKPLRPLLVGKEATLRELSFLHIGPIGRAQILELASMAASSVGGLSLRKLRIADSYCSYRRSGPYGHWNECRLSAMDALKAAAPTLDVILEAPWCKKGCFCSCN